jgi:hypothetical protein
MAQRAADLQAIERLQRIYGYSLDNRMCGEAVELFTEDARFELVDTGAYLGKAGIAKFLGSMACGSIEESRGRLSIHTQMQGVVDVDERGRSAKGRRHCLAVIGDRTRSSDVIPGSNVMPPTIARVSTKMSMSRRMEFGAYHG